MFGARGGKVQLPVKAEQPLAVARVKTAVTSQWSFAVGTSGGKA